VPAEPEKRPAEEPVAEVLAAEPELAPPAAKKPACKLTAQKLKTFTRTRSPLENHLFLWESWEAVGDYGDAHFFNCVSKVDIKDGLGGIVIPKGAALPRVDWLLSKSTAVFHIKSQHTYSDSVVCPLTVCTPVVADV